MRLAGWDVERWLRGMPSVEEARPAACPVCAAASRRVGGRLGLHGHGVRERQCWGVVGSDAEPTIRGLLCRRYRCVHCAATVTVGPEAMVRRLVYLATTIAVALWRWGVVGQPASHVRRELSPWRVHGEAGRSRWASLRRWARWAGKLWPSPASAARTLRERAAAIARRLGTWSARPFSVEAMTERDVVEGAVRRLAG